MNKTNEILTQINKVVIGKEEITSKVLMALLANGHILLEDVPGVGKTTLALTFGKVLGIDVKRMQFTSDTTPSDITGFTIFDKKENDFVYKEGVSMTNLLLADEINRTSSKTQSALLEVMEEHSVTVDGITHPVPVPFTVIATQNPIGSVGTQLLPDSQLDRFMVQLHLGYPDFKSQVNILRDRHHSNPLDAVVTIITKKELISMQSEVTYVHMEDVIYEYITHLVEATRANDSVQIGISPRGALALSDMSKAYAYVNNRDYVVCEDIMAVFSDVCAHRLLLNPKARITGTSASDICGQILSSVPIPTLMQ